MLDGVTEVLRVTEPYKLASRAFKPEGTVVTIGDVRVGGDEVIVMAGPCSAETDEQVNAVAAAVKKAGREDPARRRLQAAQLTLQLPGPRRRRAADAASAASSQHDLKLVSEVMDISQIELIDRYADIFQLGARNMQNFTLLRELGRARKPVLLKRGISATIEEWLLSAEYILAGGNAQVILCERGIRTFESYTRNTLDISAIPVVKKRSHLPIIADPSHGTGRRDKVAPMARAAVAAGADGLHHRSPLRSRSRAERRGAVAVPAAVRSADGRTAYHCSGHRPDHLPRARGQERLELSYRLRRFVVRVSHRRSSA